MSVVSARAGVAEATLMDLLGPASASASASASGAGLSAAADVTQAAKNFRQDKDLESLNERVAAMVIDRTYWRMGGTGILKLGDFAAAPDRAEILKEIVRLSGVPGCAYTSESVPTNNTSYSLLRRAAAHAENAPEPDVRCWYCQHLIGSSTYLKEWYFPRRTAHVCCVVQESFLMHPTMISARQMTELAREDAIANGDTTVRLRQNLNYIWTTRVLRVVYPGDSFQHLWEAGKPVICHKRGIYIDHDAARARDPFLRLGMLQEAQLSMFGKLINFWDLQPITSPEFSLRYRAEETDEHVTCALCLSPMRSGTESPDFYLHDFLVQDPNRAKNYHVLCASVALFWPKAGFFTRTAVPGGE